MNSILVLKSSDEHGLCYIDTQNLDGEANLKQREVPRGFVDRVSKIALFKTSLFSRNCFSWGVRHSKPGRRVTRFT